MRINSHAHIFNLKSVFTKTTLEILLRRLVKRTPGPVLEELTVLLERALDRSDTVSSDDLIRKFLGSLKARIGDLGMLSLADRVKLDLLTRGTLDGASRLVVDGVAKPFLARIIEHFTADANDFEEQQGLQDILGFLSIALQPNISHVAQQLMNELPEAEDAAIALMMDITGEGSSDRHFERHVADTSNAILEHPGRILPFVAVNPLRARHLEIMKRAITEQGFVGVKLYPSLGYDIQSAKMKRVYEWCEAKEVPLLVHCNKTGFYATAGDIPRSDPEHWRDVLSEFPNLKVCFGHFGGDDVMAETEGLPEGCWTETICRLMRRHKGVFADVSYHTDCALDGDKDRRYFGNLASLLEDHVIGKRILFGTDFWLVRMAARDQSIWGYFGRKIPSSHFDAMTLSNPAAFLGLPISKQAPSQAIKRHAEFVHENRGNVLRPPTSWLRSYIETLSAGSVKYSGNALGLAWARSNEAHARVFRWMRADQMYEADKKLMFEECGRFPVNRLQYWNKGFESEAIFMQKCRSVATRLDRYFTTNGAVVGDGATKQDAIDQMTELLSQDETRFTGLGVLADKLYRFENED